MNTLSIEHKAEIPWLSFAAAAEPAGHDLPRQLVFGFNEDEQTLLEMLDAALADAAALDISADRCYTLLGIGCV
jgi:hypothetical protein